MNLYHGTYEENFVKIVDDRGIINTNNNNNCTKDSATNLLDELIKKYTGKDIRIGCVYLTDDNDCTQAYDYAFTIDINDLDTNNLYVAENSVLDEIIGLYYDNEDESKLISKIQDYYNTYIPYAEYLDLGICYKSPEYIYYDDIEVEITDGDIEECENIKKELA